MFHRSLDVATLEWSRRWRASQYGRVRPKAIGCIFYEQTEIRSIKQGPVI